MAALAGVKFIPNPAGIFALANSAIVVQAVEALASAIAEAAKANAPYDSESDGPHYRDLIIVEDGEIPGTKVVVASKFTSYWLEVGTEDTPAFAPLRKGADQVGVVLKAGDDQ